MLLAALLAWGVARLIVTDREAIDGVIEDAAVAAARDDWDAVAAAIDETVTAGARDKPALLAWLRTAARSERVTHLSASVVDAKISGDRATARVRAGGGSAEGPWRATASVDLVRRENGWRICGVSDEQLGWFLR